MKKPSILLLTGNATIGEDFVDYLGFGDDKFPESSSGSYIPAAPADIRTNFTLSEGELSLNYLLRSKTSTFSINLFSQTDNIILSFNEYPAFCIVKKLMQKEF